MRPGWNPLRRNRKIGTKQHGVGDDNELVIPESRHNHYRYWETLRSYSTVCRRVGIKDQLFFVEPTIEGFFYPCSIDDIAVILRTLTPDELASFDFLVLRQPTRKQRILCPVWGRCVLAVDIGKHWGTAIVIEAKKLGSYLKSKSLSPEQARELDRLRGDGHQFKVSRRAIEVTPTAASMRNTVLYRTLLHEIGHFVDFRKSGDAAWDSKSIREREDFAHRFADEHREHLAMRGIIPFESMLDPAAFEGDGLSLAWFLGESGCTIR